MTMPSRVKMSALDRMISAISPQAGLARMNAKSALSVYQSSTSVSRVAGAFKGTLANWFVRRVNRNGERLERETIVDRAQDLISNDAHAASVIDSMAVNIAGVGLSPQSTPYQKALGLNDTQLADFQESAEWAFSLWAESADVGGKMPFWAMQHLAARSMLSFGEFLILPTMVRDATKSFSFGLQALNPTRLFTPSDKVADINVREGIEFSGVKPSAYYVSTPKAANDFRYSLSSNAFTKIPAMIGHRPGIFHGFIQKDPEQVRGVSVLAPAMKFFRDLSDYLDFELVGAIVAASFPIFVESTNPLATAKALDGFGTSTTGERYQEVVPGAIMYGRNGERPHVLSPNRPGNTFPDFVERILRAVGASVGMPYEVIAKDFSKTNYSSARAALLEAWRVFLFYQKWLVSLFCRHCWEMVLEEAWLRGMLVLPPGAPDWYDAQPAYARATWIPPKRGNVDPVKEIESIVTALENNLITLADASMELGGGDWEDRLRQRAREKDLEKALGIESVKKGLPKTTKDKSNAEDGQ